MNTISSKAGVAPITAIVTAYRRADQTVDTLKRIFKCDPPPGEVLVHVDGGEVDCANTIRAEFPDIVLVMSEGNVGPGGGRNKLIAAAKFEWVASFDDDSYPVDINYFQRLLVLIDKFPTTSVFTGAVFHQGEAVDPGGRNGRWVADFSGCACVYRRQHFLRTTGYVPLPLAYGMEEVDLAMRLHAQGNEIFHTGWLRVIHDTNLDHHQDPRITSASITNLALLAYLRYPPSCWWIGLVQIANRILWLHTHGRRRGIYSGLLDMPVTLYKLRCYRETLSRSAVKSYLSLRRNALESIRF